MPMPMPVVPFLGLSLSEFVLGQQAVFQVYGAGLSAVTSASLATSLAGVQWSVAAVTASTTSVQITATPSSTRERDGGLGDAIGDLTVTVNPGQQTQAVVTYANITYRLL